MLQEQDAASLVTPAVGILFVLVASCRGNRFSAREETFPRRRSGLVQAVSINAKVSNAAEPGSQKPQEPEQKEDADGRIALQSGTCGLGGTFADNQAPVCKVRETRGLFPRLSS